MGLNNVALATRKGLLICDVSDNRCKVVYEAFVGSHVSYVFVDPRSGHLFACLDDGHFGNKLFRWDGFATVNDLSNADPKTVWNELATPQYPEGAKLPKGDDAVLKYQWAIATGSDDQPGRLYFGTEPGGLFVTDDHGDNFSFCHQLWDHPTRTGDIPWMGGGRDEAAIDAICIDPRNHDHVRVAISVAGVFESLDGMNSWAPVNKGLKADYLPEPDVEVGHDPHMMVQAPSNPDVFWQQNHCGVFVSSDACQTWKCVSRGEGPEHFGFAIAVDSQDENVAWVVPAVADMNRVAIDKKLCVCRTDDRGETWTAFRAGLPQENCYDFAFRHALQFRNDELVFGTACGALYLSRDRGQSWHALAEHLPPIYSVEIL